MRSGRRRPVNLSLDTGVVEAARAAELNLSQVCEASLREATRSETARRWQADHREAIEAVNGWIERNGIPLSDLPPL